MSLETEPSYYTEGIGQIDRRFDAAGNPISVTNPQGDVRHSTFDTSGNLLKEIDASGQVISELQYDAYGRVTLTHDPRFAPTTTTYTLDGQVASRTQLGINTRYTYDDAGRVQAETDALDNSWTYAYEDNRFTTIDPLNRETTVVRNNSGQPVRLINADGTEVQIEYFGTAAQGETGEQLRRIIDESGRVREFTYDDTTLNGVTDLGGNTYTISTSVANDLLTRSITSPGGISRAVEFDDEHRQVAIVYPDGGRSSLEYDGDSQEPARIISPDGTVKTYTYDNTGDPAEVTASDGSFRRFLVDDRGRLNQTEDNSGLTQYNYDDRDLLQQITYPSGGHVAYEYNEHGELLTVTAAAGPGETEYVTTYAYDIRGFIDTITDAAGGVTEMEYDEVGRLVERRLPNDFVSTWGWDATP